MFNSSSHPICLFHLTVSFGEWWLWLTQGLAHVLTLCDPMDCSPPGSSPGKNTGVGCHALLQGIFLTQGLLHCRQILYCLSHQLPIWVLNECLLIERGRGKPKWFLGYRYRVIVFQQFDLPNPLHNHTAELLSVYVQSSWWQQVNISRSLVLRKEACNCSYFSSKEHLF